MLAFVAQRVDEAPARPKAVAIIDKMPLTNVGKIYKPELRLMAAKAVVAALVAETCTALDVRDDARPTVGVDAERRVTVLLDAAALGAAMAPVHERLRVLLERLPVKTLLASVSPHASEPSANR